MKKCILKLALFSLLTGVIALMPFRGVCDEMKENKPVAGSEEKPKRDTVPFHGKIAAIDKDAMTFTIGEREFQVTADTTIKKDGKEATLADAAVGDEVGGVAKKSEDGKLVVTSLRLGPKPEKAAEKSE